ncbi:MAG: hypothetical protein LUF78_13225 [Clostridiales bacterium]|nr:hypothetical protein [Clostridiales bacterium]
MENTAREEISGGGWKKYIRIILIAALIFYPLVGAFWGLDLGDTGYHLFAYTNLASNPEKINYTTYLSTVIGYVWNLLFGWMGLIAFNLLEVFLEWALMAVVYRSFRDLLGDLTTLSGLLIAVIAADTYLNIFNYHQLNAFFLVVILCLEIRGITGDKCRYSLFAGIVYMLLVFSRVGSVVAVVTCFLYVYDKVMYGISWKRMAQHLLCFAAGVGIVAGVLLTVLVASGNMQYFINNIFRLEGIASDESSAYSLRNLMTILIEGNLEVIASGFLFAASAGVLACAFNIGFHHCETRLKKVFCVLIAFLAGGVALYQMYYAYDVNPAEDWAQMTTGPRFLIGVMYVIAFGCYVFYAFRKDGRSRRMTLLVLASYLLVLLTIAGSNTGTKHVILAMWFIAPVCVYTVRRLCTSEGLALWMGEVFARIHLNLHRLTIPCVTGVVVIMFFAKFFHFAYYTFNYDCTDRTQLTATLDNDRVRFIRTTEREANAVEGVLEAIEEYSEDEDQPLQVFGNSLLFYYMTDREAYSAAWVTPSTYSLERFQNDMESGAENYGDVLPVVVYCRTEYSDGFEEELVEENQWKVTSSWYDGKKEYFVEFMMENGYEIVYTDDYYLVLAPNLADDSEDFLEMQTIIYGW